MPKLEASRAYLHESMQSVYRAVAELVDGVRSVNDRTRMAAEDMSAADVPAVLFRTRRTPASATGTPSSSTASGGARSRSRSWRWSSSAKRAQRPGPGTPRSRGGRGDRLALARQHPATPGRAAGEPEFVATSARRTPVERQAIESIPHFTAREVKTGKPPRDARIFQEEHEKEKGRKHDLKPPVLHGTRKPQGDSRRPERR